jgi:carbonic anhydrase/acetyltransferase-like protein (isoleucine patch superfamily)
MAGLIRPYQGVMPKLGKNVWVAETAAIIGDVEIGDETSIWYGVVIRGDMNFIRIGARTNIQDGVVIHVNAEEGDYRTGRPTYIGDDVTVGHLAMLHACTLEDESFVGMSATVLDEAVVEARAMVAAGAVVTPGKRVPTGELWAGAPAKCMREVRDEDIAGLKVSAAHYRKIALNYLEEEK